MLQERRRKSLRLKGWDYGRDGVYFITICTQDRPPILWERDVGQGLCPCLSPQGKIAEDELLALSQRFPGVGIAQYVVMPNHVHILLSLTGQGQSPQRQGQSPQRQGQSPQRQGQSPQRQGQSPQRQGQSPQRQGQSPQRQGQSPCPTVGSVIGAYKSITTKRVNQLQNSPGQKLWQFRFYDHIVRDEADYLRIWNYIETNPAKWQEDRYYRP